MTCTCGVGRRPYDCAEHPKTLPTPTAYDQAQAELLKRLAALTDNADALLVALRLLRDNVHARIDKLEADVIRAELGVPDKELASRLDAALQRIEQLEREVAVLKGPRLDVEGRERWMSCPHVGCTRPGCDGNHPVQGPYAALSDNIMEPK